MDELTALESLARAMGVATRYTDGLRQPVTAGPETLVRVCASLGAPVARPADAAGALRALAEDLASDRLPPVLVAWDGILATVLVPGAGSVAAEIRLEGGDLAPIEVDGRAIRSAGPLPAGYHRLTVDAGGAVETATIISAPEQAWRRPGSHRSWGVGGQLAAFRSARSRSLGDLRDLETVCRWVGDRGGDLVMVLPLLPIFNDVPVEPSPYSSVSRLFWSELILELGDAHRPVEISDTLDRKPADVEVRAALAGSPLPDPARLDPELIRYARFRGAQARLGRNWRDWPAGAREGVLGPEHVDAGEERFHLVAQDLARQQLGGLRQRLEEDGIRFGFDLPVG
ncbi:MAG: 4-alpha-glucanotransferase, partial [Gemmatimonadetes bacterium]|nr:4-alpha-glucanotransferase [Gemmatimonadota bacterium]